MISSLRKDQEMKNAECHAEKKGSGNSLSIHHEVINSFTEVIPLEEIDFRRIASPTSSVYSDAQNSITSFSSKNMCFGDSLSPLLEISSKSEKDIGVLGDNIMKQIFVKKNFTTNKIVHIDIAPENECSKSNEESCNKDTRKINETCALRTKANVEKTHYKGILVDDSNKEVYGTSVKQPVAPKKIRCEDTCDGERRVRWSPETSKFDYFRRNFDDLSSTESLDQSVLKGEKFPNFSRRGEPSPEISPRIKKMNRSYMSRETVESFAQTDNPNKKSKKKSKFKMILLEVFLSCVRCFM